MSVAFADLAQRYQPEAEVGVFDLDARTRKFAHDTRHWRVGIVRGAAKYFSVTLARILVVEEAMQERCVHRIDADFKRLQPVAVDHSLEREGMAVGGNKAIEIRECRRLARTEIGEENA